LVFEILNRGKAAALTIQIPVLGSVGAREQHFLSSDLLTAIAQPVRNQRNPSALMWKFYESHTAHTQKQEIWERSFGNRAARFASKQKTDVTFRNREAPVRKQAHSMNNLDLGFRRQLNFDAKSPPWHLWQQKKKQRLVRIGRRRVDLIRAPEPHHMTALPDMPTAFILPCGNFPNAHAPDSRRRHG
jgi:hypothetical protein